MFKFLTFFICLFSWQISYAVVDLITLGQEKAAPCAACHGVDGNSTVGEWPKLAGQHADYLVEQMLAYQQGEQGERYDEIMTPLMQTLSVEEIEAIAAYYSSQQVVVGTVDPALLERGQQLYRGGDLSKQISACIACHGPDGVGNNDAGFPQLSGQHPEYIVEELMQYKSGERSTDYNCIMHDIAQRMDPEDMQAVAAYVYGLY